MLKASGQEHLGPGPPDDIVKCHQIIEGLRILINVKDEDIRQLQASVGVEYSKIGGILIPAVVQNELNTLKDENQQLLKALTKT